jgi:hypothetical protein
MTQGLSILKYTKMLQIPILEEVSHAFYNALTYFFYANTVGLRPRKN